MKTFNGITFKRNEAWGDLLALYPGKTEKEVEDKLEAGVRRAFDKMEMELSEDVYTASINDLAGIFDLRKSFVSLLVLRRWNQTLENVLDNIIIIGTGECGNCGADGLEKWDEDILECSHCKMKVF